MTDLRNHYPDFNVMDGQKHWDTHTREIVGQRLKTQAFYPYQFFTQQEANTLSHLCAHLLDDHRYPVIAFVVHHFDTTLKNSPGESQRKTGVPAQTALIRDGLTLLDEACGKLYGGAFGECGEDDQQKVVNALMQDTFPLQNNQTTIPVPDFMQKIMSEAVSAYYSHPAVWSDIGYAGPAYPRGYVRTELGLTDPWEARRP